MSKMSIIYIEERDELIMPTLINMYIDVVQIQFNLVPGIIQDRKDDRQLEQFTGVLKPCKVTKYNINK